ncbi:nitroreductase/quinone reductase family protein [Nocardia jejuensis]|uniref:nitroreductase/quinone reductase family protein n=1 Tax=Nocardia jejuensis TaxID=328049 RepID=UPI00082C993F|nr:nitroreductase/quinone reductase family protein [Nocardia jejuensis]
MADEQRTAQRSGGPGPVSRWFQLRMNARANKRIRKGKGSFMGMDLLILTTVGKRSGQPRQSPVAWFGDGDDSWLIVASGGGDRNPDWYANLMANPDRATIELPGRDPVAVRPLRLEGAEREQGWQLIATAAPQIAKYQSKSDRQYPVVRLTPR